SSALQLRREYTPANDHASARTTVRTPARTAVRTAARTSSRGRSRSARRARISAGRATPGVRARRADVERRSHPLRLAGPRGVRLLLRLLDRAGLDDPELRFLRLLRHVPADAA